MHRRTVYSLPGAGGQIHTGLGEGILGRGYDVAGRETLGDFQRLPFQEKIDLISQDLQGRFWETDALVICNSYGAYLFLHAQASMKPFPGKVLLLSPILGPFSNDEAHRGYVPPRAHLLKEIASSGRYPAPRRAELHVGSEDWQSRPNDVSAFGKATGIDVTVVPGRGHMLGKDYVGALLDRWLCV